MIWVILLPSTVRGEFSRNAPAKLQVGYRCISLAELRRSHPAEGFFESSIARTSRLQQFQLRAENNFIFRAAAL